MSYSKRKKVCYREIATNQTVDWGLITFMVADDVGFFSQDLSMSTKMMIIILQGNKVKWDNSSVILQDAIPSSKVLIMVINKSLHLKYLRPLKKRHLSHRVTA
jgi:hypothetical protein